MNEWFLLLDIFLRTRLAKKVQLSVYSVRPSVCLSICFHAIFRTDRHLNESFRMTVACLELKLNVISQGQGLD